MFLIRSETDTRGHVTGSGRKLKDNAADWHNLALKWDRLNDAGSTYATNIVNFTLQKDSRELEEECVKLQDVVEKMVSWISSFFTPPLFLIPACPLLLQTRVLSKMEKMASSDQGICALETFQFGDEGRPTPLFHTWSTPHFGTRSVHISGPFIRTGPE
uniref:Uncharacterized protein n=1 Tax=Denticeps clupeoides TaxID=299321 RepID=A0AAY4BMZ2_9TELE